MKIQLSNDAGETVDLELLPKGNQVRITGTPGAIADLLDKAPGLESFREGDRITAPTPMVADITRHLILMAADALATGA